MTKSNYFILTGAMGAGKSTLLTELRQLGMIAIDEPARQILAEQRSIQGAGVPENDPALFTHLLLSRSMFQFQQMQDQQGPIIFDRGIPDNIGYARLFGISDQSALNASEKYRYNSQVFMLPAWEAIYENDEERKMSFEQAKQFGHDIKNIYQTLGYQVVDVPLKPPHVRAQFIIDNIGH